MVIEVGLSAADLDEAREQAEQGMSHRRTK